LTSGGLLTVSIRVKLATLAGAIVAIVVLGQTMQSLVVSSMAVQEELSLRARLVLMSVAGVIALKWEPGVAGGPDGLPELEPLAERVARVLEVHSFALLDAGGEVVTSVGEAPSEARLKQVGHLRLRSMPSSIWAIASRPLELVARAPIIKNDRIVGYVFCSFTSDEPRARLKTLVQHALYSALFWVALGGGLTLWLARRFTQPLIDLAATLDGGGELYTLPPEGSSDGELGVVQRRLVDYTDRIQVERGRAEGLNEQLRHQVEVVSADLARTAEQRQAILDSVEDAILLCDSEARILVANRVARRWLARKEEGEGEAAFDPASAERPGERGRVEDAKEGEIQLGQQLHRAILRVAQTGRGESFPMEEIAPPEAARAPRGPAATSNGSLPPPPHGSMPSLRARVHPATVARADGASVIVVLEDLSTWRALEEQVLQSERLATLGTLSAGLAHQVGNSLNAIRGHAELAGQAAGSLAGGVDPERVTHMVAGIRDEVRAAAELMHRVLQLARTEPVPTVALEIPVLIREAIALAEVHARHKGVKIESELADPGCSVWGDPQLLTQVLLNLFLNAIHAMGKGGQLRVASRCAGTGFCALTIEDDGPGVPPVNAERIFEPFFTTKAIGEGTGLGLPIARRIVELHGGSLRLDPRAGGARFLLDLPVAREDAPRELSGGDDEGGRLLGGLFRTPGAPLTATPKDQTRGDTGDDS